MDNESIVTQAILEDDVSAVAERINAAYRHQIEELATLAKQGVNTSAAINRIENAEQTAITRVNALSAAIITQIGAEKDLDVAKAKVATATMKANVLAMEEQEAMSRTVGALQNTAKQRQHLDTLREKAAQATANTTLAVALQEVEDTKLALAELKLGMAADITAAAQTKLAVSMDAVTGSAAVTKEAILGMDTRLTLLSGTMVTGQRPLGGMLLGMSGLAGISPIAAGAVLGVGIALTTTIGATIEWNKLLTELHNNTQATSAEIQTMAADVLEAGTNMGANFEQMILGARRILDYSFQADDAVKILNITTKAAIATGAEEAGVAQGIAQALHQFGESADYAAQYTNILLVNSQRANSTLEDFSENTKRATGLAAELGVSYAETTSAISALTRVYGNVLAAQTQVVNVMRFIVHPTDESAEAWDNLARKSGNAEIASKNLAKTLAMEGLTGVLASVNAAFVKLGYTHEQIVQTTYELITAQRGGQGLLLLLSEANKDYLDGLEAANGVIAGKLDPTTEAFNRTQATSANRWAVVGDGLKKAAITIGENLTPTINDLARSVSVLIPPLVTLLDIIAKIGATAINPVGRFVSEDMKQEAEETMRRIDDMKGSVDASLIVVRREWDKSTAGSTRFANTLAANASALARTYRTAVGKDIPDAIAEMVQAKQDSIGTNMRWATGQQELNNAITTSHAKSTADVKRYLSEQLQAQIAEQQQETAATIASGRDNSEATSLSMQFRSEAIGRLIDAYSLLEATELNSVESTSNAMIAGSGIYGQQLAANMAAREAYTLQMEADTTHQKGLIEDLSDSMQDNGNNMMEAWVELRNTAQTKLDEINQAEIAAKAVGGDFSEAMIIYFENLRVQVEQDSALAQNAINALTETMGTSVRAYNTWAEAMNATYKALAPADQQYHFGGMPDIPPPSARQSNLPVEKPARVPKTPRTPTGTDPNAMVASEDRKLAAVENATAAMESLNAEIKLNKMREDLAGATKDLADVTTYYDGRMKSLTDTQKAFAAVSEETIHKLDVELHNLGNTLQDEQKWVKALLLPLQEEADKARQHLQDLQEEIDNMDDTFTEAMYQQQQAMDQQNAQAKVLANQMRDLETEEKNAMAAINAVIEMDQKALDAAQASMDAIEAFWDQKIRVKQRLLDDLTEQDTKRDQAKELGNMAQAVGNLQARIDSARPGSKQYNELLKQRDETMFNLQNKTKEYTLEDQIKALEAEKTMAMEGAAAKVKAAQEVLAADKEMAAQMEKQFAMRKEELAMQQELVARQQENIQNEMDIIAKRKEQYDHDNKARLDQAEAESKAADKKLADEEKLTDAYLATIQAVIDAKTRQKNDEVFAESERDRQFDKMIVQLQTEATTAITTAQAVVDNFATILGTSQKAKDAQDFADKYAKAIHTLTIAIDAYAVPVGHAADGTKLYAEHSDSLGKAQSVLATALNTDATPAITTFTNTITEKAPQGSAAWMKYYAPVAQGGDANLSVGVFMDHRNNQGFYARLVTSADLGLGVDGFRGKVNTRITEAGTDLGTKLDELATDAALRAETVGTKMLDGVTLGLGNKEKKAALAQALIDAVLDAIAAAEAKLITGSPSRLTEDLLGVPAIQGVGTGALRGAAQAARDFNTALNTVLGNPEQYSVRGSSLLATPLNLPYAGRTEGGTQVAELHLHVSLPNVKDSRDVKDPNTWVEAGIAVNQGMARAFGNRGVNPRTMSN